MAIARIERYGFAYPQADGQLDRPVFDGVSLTVDAGAFVVLAGPTGCGKTTLLRSLKPEVAPVGSRSGSIELLDVAVLDEGVPTGRLDVRASASQIGFVMQDPAAQIVCDTVWHELAFGLENLGVEPGEMRRRVAEVAHFFGIGPWMHASTESLSGGQ